MRKKLQSQQKFSQIFVRWSRSEEVDSEGISAFMSDTGEHLSEFEFLELRNSGQITCIDVGCIVTDKPEIWVVEPAKDQELQDWLGDSIRKVIAAAIWVGHRNGQPKTTETTSMIESYDAACQLIDTMISRQKNKINNYQNKKNHKLSNVLESLKSRITSLRMRQADLMRFVDAVQAADKELNDESIPLSINQLDERQKRLTAARRDITEFDKCQKLVDAINAHICWLSSSYQPVHDATPKMNVQWSRSKSPRIGDLALMGGTK